MSTAISRAWPSLSRRGFLKTGAATAALICGGTVGDGYPETLVWAFNDSVPGPVIRTVLGERLEINVTNELAEPTTVHFLIDQVVPVGRKNL